MLRGVCRRLSTAAARECAAPYLLRASAAASEYASTPWRQIAGATPQQLAAWADDDERLHAEMRKHVPAALAHNGEEAFDNHLVGVQSVLRSWGASTTLTHAALFHSIYGTEGFQGFKLPLSSRGEIADLIGPEAERLAWIFCMVDRSSVDATVLSNAPGASFRSRPELGAFEIALRSADEWRDFLTLSLADWLEQVEGAARKANPAVGWGAGEAWAYRRDAYACMATILSDAGVGAAPVMHAEVYAREPEATRSLVQPSCPPVGDAAREAREAMASARANFDGGARDATPVGSDEGWLPRPRAQHAH